MKTNPGNYYLTLNIYRHVMERGWGSGNRRRAAPMGSPKHAQSRITDVPVFAAVAAAESSAPDTKHLVQRWTVNLLSSRTWGRDGWQKLRCWFPGRSSSENSVRCKYWMLFYSSRSSTGAVCKSCLITCVYVFKEVSSCIKYLPALGLTWHCVTLCVTRPASKSFPLSLWKVAHVWSSLGTQELVY